jgi:hypothetical protein
MKVSKKQEKECNRKEKLKLQIKKGRKVRNGAQRSPKS